MRIGIFGGTFDPPHIGHILIAQEAVLKLGLDKLFFVPSGNPPHKTGVTPKLQRFEMAFETVCHINDPFDDRRAKYFISPFEVNRDEISFTADTVAHFREEYPEAELFVIIGADQARAFDTWEKREGILEHATVVVVNRHAHPYEINVDQYIPIEVPALGVSSTLIRERVRNGYPIRYYVVPDVERLIKLQGLYGATIEDADSLRPGGRFETTRPHHTP